MKNYVKEYKGRRVPEGATHCDDARSMFYKETDEAVFSCEFGELIWVDTDFLDVTANIHLKELPEEPAQEWNGQGRLSADMICLMEDNTGPDREVEVLFIGSQIAVVKPVDGLGGEMAVNLTGYVKFKPLKTQEQKDREAFIDKVMTGTSIDVKSAPIVHNIAEQLFEAGFKAPEGD